MQELEKDVEDVKVRIDKIAGMIYILDMAFSAEVDKFDKVLLHSGIDAILETMQELQEAVNELNIKTRLLSKRRGNPNKTEF